MGRESGFSKLMYACAGLAREVRLSIEHQQDKAAQREKVLLEENAKLQQRVSTPTKPAASVICRAGEVFLVSNVGTDQTEERLMGITDREVHDAIKLGIAKRDTLVAQANNVKSHSLDLLDASIGSMDECLASLKNLKADIDWLENHIEQHTVKPNSLETDLREAIAGLDL